MSLNSEQLNEITDEELLEAFPQFQQRFDVYAAAVLKIKTKAGKIIPFVFNRCQKRLWQLFIEDWNSGKPIRWYIIKGRQVGTTTWCAALLYWLSSLWANKNALILNYDEDAAENLGAKVQEFYQFCRPIMRPAFRKMNRKQIHFAKTLREFRDTGEIGLNSHIDNSTVDAGSLGRSYTYQYVVMSEYCFYEQNIKGKTMSDQLSSLYATIPLEYGTVIIKESTPFGDGQAREEWNDENGFRKIFISWICEENYRIDNPSPFILSDVEESLFGDEKKERDNIWNELTFWYPERANDVEWLERECLSRLAWRRQQITDYLGKSKDKFRQEYPTTVDQAFAGKSESIFGGYRIKELEDQLALNNLAPTKFRYLHNDDEQRISRKFYQAAYGHLIVYEAPVPGVVYVVGGDGAQGVDGGDDSSLYVLRLPDLVEVAMFSDIIRPREFAGVANALGRLYNCALLGIEVNDKGGFAAMSHLVEDYNYPNPYFRTGASNSARTIQYGFITHDINRQFIIDDFKGLVKDGHITIRSQKLLDQMKSFVQDKKSGKCAAAKGKHDDVVMAAMISVQLARMAKIYQPPPPTSPKKGTLDWWMKRIEKQGSNARRMKV